MSLSSYRRNETWIPTPPGTSTIVSAIGTSTIVSAIRELSRAGWPEFAAVCLFVLAGLSAVLVAVGTLGPAFDYGGILAAAG